MSCDWLQQAVHVAGMTAQRQYPRDLISMVPLTLPLGIVSVAGLTTASLRSWLDHRRIAHGIDGPPRKLHGALCAMAGRGLLFLDGSDDAAEQRFTVAHEAAHFILEHLLPRLDALEVFGEPILAVLDGERPPSPEESVSAILNRVPIGVHVHLMRRTRIGTIPTWEIEKREQRADRLALELIAPAKDATLELRKLASSASSSNALGAHRAGVVLSHRFGLPLQAARAYAEGLMARRRHRSRLTELLIGGDQQ